MPILRALEMKADGGIMADNYLPPEEEDYAFAEEEMKSREGFSKMKAIEDGNIIMCSDFCLRGGGNTVGLAFFAKWLHPELFEDFDAYEIFDQWMTEFQNMDAIEGHVYEG